MFVLYPCITSEEMDEKLEGVDKPSKLETFVCEYSRGSEWLVEFEQALKHFKESEFKQYKSLIAQFL